MTEKTELAKLSKPADKTEAVALVADDVLEQAKVLAASGAFPDTQTAGLALAKIEIGRSLGLGPAQSMMGISMVEGKPFIGANILAAAVKRADGYDYRVKEHDATKCVIEFYEIGDERESVGLSEYTIDDAKKAGAKFKSSKGRDLPWTTSPKNMLFARAISNGVKWFCPDVLGTVVYVNEERDLIRAEAREEREVAPEPVVTITAEEAKELDDLLIGACEGPDDMAMLLLAQNADACEDLTPEGAEAIRRTVAERAGEPEPVVEGEVVNDD